MRLFILAILLLSTQLWAVPTSFYYQGVATDSSGTAINGPIGLKLQVGGLNGSGDFCILWEETFAAVSVSSTGAFQVEVGGGTSTFNISFLNALSSSSFASVSPANTCGGSFTVTSARFLRTHYYNGTTYLALSPDVTLAGAPYSAVAQTLQGKLPSDLIQVNVSTQLSQGNLEAAFSNTNYPILTQLLAGTSSLYLKNGQALSTPSVSSTGSIVTPTAGMQVYETTTNQLKIYNGSTWVTLGAGSAGTVTNVSSGNSYLNVANQSTTPAITANVGTVSNTLAAGDDSRIVGAAQLSAQNIFTSGGQSIFNTSDLVPLTLKGTSGQSANLFEVKNNASTTLYSLSASGSPTLNSDLVTKNYVDSFFVPSTGGVMSGMLMVNNDIVSNSRLSTGIGAEALPAIASNSDPNTGIFYPSAGSWGVSSSGVNRIVISPSGSIGIGKMSPTQIMDIEKNTSSPTVVQLGNLTTGPLASAKFRAVNSTVYADFGVSNSGYTPVGPIAGNEAYFSTNTNLNIQTGSSGFIRLSTGATITERMRIDPVGNIGIGTTAPQAVLDIVSTTPSSAIIVPRAPTGARPGSPVNGMIRYNTTTLLFEFFENGAWVNYTTISDARLKTNIVSVEQALQTIEKLNPVYFDWDQNNIRGQSFGTKHQVGFLAQEVESILPEVVNKGQDGYRSVEYGKIVAVVVAAVKELHSLALDLVKNDYAKDQEIAELKIRLSRLEKILETKLEK